MESDAIKEGSILVRDLQKCVIAKIISKGSDEVTIREEVNQELREPQTAWPRFNNLPHRRELDMSVKPVFSF